ncbi:hypothetical protein I4F81_002014 [Pyropia yezoensis]|uniref:Uncharacterized protein n=1 Tax=Pyropia yezoensis TaxID=2788 RepID=A0ACC3BNB7_PYRYE|nr:hypothetical protein I4F81_002014 [Neopyropia yezoensis]
MAARWTGVRRQARVCRRLRPVTGAPAAAVAVLVVLVVAVAAAVAVGAAVGAAAAATTVGAAAVGAAGVAAVAAAAARPTAATPAAAPKRLPGTTPIPPVPGEPPVVAFDDAYALCDAAGFPRPVVVSNVTCPCHIYVATNWNEVGDEPSPTLRATATIRLWLVTVGATVGPPGGSAATAVAAAAAAAAATGAVQAELDALVVATLGTFRELPPPRFPLDVPTTTVLDVVVEVASSGRRSCVVASTSSTCAPEQTRGLASWPTSASMQARGGGGDRHCRGRRPRRLDGGSSGRGGGGGGGVMGQSDGRRASWCWPLPRRPTLWRRCGPRVALWRPPEGGGQPRRGGAASRRRRPLGGPPPPAARLERPVGALRDGAAAAGDGPGGGAAGGLLAVAPRVRAAGRAAADAVHGADGVARPVAGQLHGVRRAARRRGARCTSWQRQQTRRG